MIRKNLRPLAEPAAAALSGLAGLWLALRGGWFFALLGALVIFVAVVWLVGAWRRLRFRRDVTAPGLVEIDEGAIRYYGARVLGGQIALRELTEIRLIRVSGHLHWRLRAADQALLIPLEAKGAEALADAFAALPSIDMGQIARALGETDAPSLRILWRRPA